MKQEHTKTATVEQIGIYPERWIIRGTIDGVLVYQYQHDTRAEAEADAEAWLNR